MQGILEKYNIYAARDIKECEEIEIELPPDEDFDVYEGKDVFFTKKIESI